MSQSERLRVNRPKTACAKASVKASRSRLPKNLFGAQAGKGTGESLDRQSYTFPRRESLHNLYIFFMLSLELAVIIILKAKR